ncbi:MAG TPA: DUF3299 domain-containing protein [Opitutaceae bacterium]|nr:DUF3299 domain-containing protein [Opitutaceae bacterium]
MNLRPIPAAVALLATLSFGRAADTPAGTAVPAATPPAPVQAVMKEITKAPPEMVNGYLKLGFDRLAGYTFVTPPFDPAAASEPGFKPATGEEQIPAEVKSWNGRKIMVTGFMMPVKMEKGLVTEFLLLKDPMMCCYGTVPNMNEWIVVKMKQGVLPLMDLPIAFYGELKIGAIVENGYLAGIYTLEGDKMGEVQQ